MRDTVKVMRDTVKVSLLAIAGLLLVSASLSAHHGNAGYDTRTVTVKGVVTQWLWTNPHTFLKVDETDDKGTVTHWTAEWNAPSTLINFGITAKSFKVGDMVTITMTGMAKNGAPVGRLIKASFPDGHELSMGSER